MGKAEKRVTLQTGQAVVAGGVSLRLIRVHPSGSITVSISSEGKPIEIQRPPRIARPPGTMFPRLRKGGQRSAVSGQPKAES